MPNVEHFHARPDRATELLDVARERQRDAFEVDDSRVGSVETLDAANVGLELEHPRLVDLPQAGDAVLGTAPIQLLEARDLAPRCRDDQLAAALVGNLLPVAVLIEQPAPLDAEARLQRSRRVVDPRVDNATVVSRLMARERVLFLQQREPDAGVTCQQLACDGETQDAAADDEDIVGLVG